MVAQYLKKAKCKSRSMIFVVSSYTERHGGAHVHPLLVSNLLTTDHLFP